MSPVRMLHQAAQLAFTKKGFKSYRFGALGVRTDGALVSAVNGNPPEPEPAHHCEARLLRKLTYGSVVYLCRVSARGYWLMSRPCTACTIKLRSKGCTVYYSISPGHYGTLVP